MRATASVITFVICLAASVAAQTTAPSSYPSGEDQVKVVRLTITPVGAPQPALKYRLLTPLEDQTAGDAMALYYTGATVLAESVRRDTDLADKVEVWREKPTDQIDWKQVQIPLQSLESPLQMLDLAARHKTCEWNLPVEEQGISMLLPPLSDWRSAAKILSIRMRLEVHEGRLEDAIRTARTILGMARHEAGGPTLIQGLVGVAIASMAMESLQEVLAAQNSPNLYWALSALPRPVIDMQMGLQGEKAMLLGSLPRLRDGLAGKLTPSQWDDLFREVIQMGVAMGQDRNALMLTATRVYPQGKQYMQSQGYSAEQVEAMPVGQVILLHGLHEYEVLRDDNYKWWTIPFWQAWPGLREEDKRVTQAKLSGRGFMFTDTLPSLAMAYAQATQVDRQVAALQCIEAIRMYAAGHNGQLPDALADIHEVPIPANPMTGEPFGYRRDGNKAVLDAPVPVGCKPHWNTRYELTIRR
jgi:hypothetical protein